MGSTTPRAQLPEVLCFDLDDTILRFTAGQPDAWRLSLEEHFSEEPLVTAMLESIQRRASEFWSDPERAFWGRQNMFAARELVAERALGEHGVSTETARRIGRAMTRRKEELVQPFAGAIETLASLQRQGHRLALLTNGSSDFQRRKLRRYSLEGYFELILIEGELGYGKPDRRIFQDALRHFAVRPEATLMVGDNLQADIGGAASVGIDGIWHDAHGQGLPLSCPFQPLRVVLAIHELIATSPTGSGDGFRGVKGRESD